MIRHEDTTTFPEPLSGIAFPDRRARARGRVWSVILGALWLLGGGAIIAYAGLLIYAQIARIEIDSAIIAGTVEPVRAPAAGTIREMSIEAGATLEKGAPLFTIQDPALDQAIDMQRVVVEKNISDLKLNQSMLAAERARRETYIRTQQGEIRRLEALIGELTGHSTMLAARCGELSAQYQRGLTQNWRVHDAEDKLAAVNQDLVQTRVQLDSQKQLLALAVSGQGEGGVDVVNKLPEATAAVALAREDVVLAEKTLRVLLDRRRAAAVSAPEDGRILSVLRRAGAQVQAGDPIAVMQRGRGTFIYAYVMQSEVGHLSLGDEAEVFLPAQRVTTRATIIAIQRAGAYLDDVETRYDWRSNRDTMQRLTDRDRTARVTLRFSARNEASLEHTVDVGTPAIISFKRRWYESVPGLRRFASGS